MTLRDTLGVCFVFAEECSPACLNGGICQDGVCDCPADWEGDHCQTCEYIGFSKGTRDYSSRLSYLHAPSDNGELKGALSRGFHRFFSCNCSLCFGKGCRNFCLILSCLMKPGPGTEIDKICYVIDHGLCHSQRNETMKRFNCAKCLLSCLDLEHE